MSTATTLDGLPVTTREAAATTIASHVLHGPATATFWRAYGITLRPYLFFVSGTAGLVGLAAAPAVPPQAFPAAFAAFAVSYGLGQALTDVFQTDTDALSSPYRPLVRGEIGRGAVLGVSLAGLLACGLVLGLLNPWNLLLAALAVAGLLAYTPLKRRWWGGPPCNSAVVALLPAMGLLCGTPGVVAVTRSPFLIPAMASVFASYAVFVLLGYLKDVEADRSTGYDTFAVHFGRRATVIASAVSTAAAVAASLLLVFRALPAPAGFPAPALVLWLGGVALCVLAHVRAWRVERDADAHPAVALSVRAFLALHLGEVALLLPELTLLGAGLLVAFEGALRCRPCREQI